MAIETRDRTSGASANERPNDRYDRLASPSREASRRRDARDPPTDSRLGSLHQGISHVVTPKRAQSAVDALVDARVVNVVRSSGCFLRVGSVGELVDALRDRCVAEGREFVATFVTRHWDEVSREVRGREGERTVTSGRRAREEGSEREEEEEEGRGTGKRARGDGETETETEMEMEMEETGKDEGNEGAVVENKRSVDGGTTVATTPTTATTTTSTKTPPPPPPPPPSLTERLLTQTRVAATPPKQKQKPKQKTPIATGDPPSFRVLGATILRGIHAVIHERDDALRRDMRALVDAINASHREIAPSRASPRPWTTRPRTVRDARRNATLSTTHRTRFARLHPRVSTNSSPPRTSRERERSARRRRRRRRRRRPSARRARRRRAAPSDRPPTDSNLRTDEIPTTPTRARLDSPSRRRRRARSSFASRPRRVPDASRRGNSNRRIRHTSTRARRRRRRVVETRAQTDARRSIGRSSTARDARDARRRWRTTTTRRRVVGERHGDDRTNERDDDATTSRDAREDANDGNDACRSV